jgi:hypothetical protein
MVSRAPAPVPEVEEGAGCSVLGVEPEDGDEVISLPLMFIPDEATM